MYSTIEKALYKYNNGGSFYATLNYSYAPNNLTIIEANNRYTNWANPQGTSRSNINMSISIQRKFMNKRMIIGLSAIDPLSIQKYHNYTNGANFSIESFSESNSRNFRLTISYQISKTVLKSNLNSKDKKEALERLHRE